MHVQNYYSNHVNIYTVKASTPVPLKYKKVSKFTQFSSKTTHISGCKNVYIYTLATVIV